MTIEDAKKELLIVHRKSPIGKEHEHFYSVSSVNSLIEKLVDIINEKDETKRLLESILTSICDATINVEKVDTDAGLCVTSNFGMNLLLSSMKTI